MHDCSPTTERIAVNGIQQDLRDSLKQVLWLEIGLPQSLSGSVQLILGCSSDGKVLRRGDASDTVVS